jgi:ribosomal protein S13
LVASVTDGSLDLAELSPGSAADLVKVVVLAQAVPGVGKVRSRRVLDALGVIPEARWGDMTAPLQARVVAALAESQRVVHDEQAGGKA